MVSFVDICLFSQNLATTQGVSRSELRDIATLNIEEERAAVALGGESFVPIFNGQYHIDFWLSKLEFVFVNSFVQEKNKCDFVASYFCEDVRQAYDSMQWSRIHRGEAIINDWPTLKTLLRCVFLPLEEQLHTTVSLNHLPSLSPPPKKKNIISTTQQPATDLLQKVDSLSLKVDSLSLSPCSCSCSNNKHEREVKSLKYKIADSQLQLEEMRAEIRDVLGLSCSCSNNKIDHEKHEREVKSLKKTFADSQRKLTEIHAELRDVLSDAFNKKSNVLNYKHESSDLKKTLVALLDNSEQARQGLLGVLYKSK